MTIEDFRDLTVWQKSHKLVLETYKATKGFPAEERFGLTSQMRRAAVSIAANIVEGFKKRGQKDKVNFDNISQGSLQELRYYLLLTKDLEYLNGNKVMWDLSDEVGKMLNKLIKAVGKD